MRQVEILKQLAVIENVKDRMTGLCQKTGVPESVAKQLSTDALSLDWACQELRKLYLAKLVLVAGDTRLISSVNNISNIQLPPSSFVDHGNDISSLVIFEPDQMISGIIRDYLVPGGWKGNDFPSKKNTNFLICSKYFASGDPKDHLKKAILFECMVLKTWLNEVGYNSAKQEIASWSFKVFNSMKWDEAKPVE